MATRASALRLALRLAVALAVSGCAASSSDSPEPEAELESAAGAVDEGPPGDGAGGTMMSLPSPDTVDGGSASGGGPSSGGSAGLPAASAGGSPQVEPPGSVGTGGVDSGATCSGETRWCLGELLHEDMFDSANSLKDWHAYYNDPENSSVEVENGALKILASHGTTVWFVPQLEGDLLIEYTITMIDEGGPYDRVSDLNQYWMASDADEEDWLGSNHDGLAMYYVGMGGNNNTTTRFRKMVDGDEGVTNNLLGEYTDASHLLSGAGPYQVRIVGFEWLVQYWVNGVLFFEYEDTVPHTRGRFGFRTVKNHMAADDFRVHRLIKRAP